MPRLSAVGIPRLQAGEDVNGASCQPTQPESKVQLTLAAKIAIGLVIGFAFYGLSSLLGVLK